jgi:23S rRNA pseudouridine1911/1915/1917 synthase
VDPTADAGVHGGPIFEAAAADRGRRLDVVVAERFPRYSRSRVATLAVRGQVLVDGRPRKPAFRLRAGQQVSVLAPSSDPVAVTPQPIPLAIVHEDADVLVIDKPAGMTVHPAPGHRSGTLVNAVVAHVPHLSGIAGPLRPGIVHRLDKDTSGLLVIAKTDAAYRSLVAQLRARTVTRVYLALARGAVRRERGAIAAPIGRHPVHRTRMAVVSRGRPAVTHFSVLERLPGATLVECRLETGRTHQIRVHLRHIGHPVLGDPVYGGGGAGIDRQALHAARLEFTHPRTGERIVCTAPLPEDFAKLLGILRRGESQEASAGRARSRKREV